jgi:hypothetical protein
METVVANEAKKLNKELEGYYGKQYEIGICKDILSPRTFDSRKIHILLYAKGCGSPGLLHTAHHLAEAEGFIIGLRTSLVCSLFYKRPDMTFGEKAVYERKKKQLLEDVRKERKNKKKGKKNEQPNTKKKIKSNSKSK